MVGNVMINLLKERKFPLSEIIPAASERSVGKSIKFGSKHVEVVSIAEAVAQHPAVAIFSAGSTVSKEWAPKFAEVGTTVIDNSSCWRMYPHIPLVVPEVNADVLSPGDRIIANPNCSTIQLVMALSPLHKRYGIKRIVISTYQSVTGTGVKAVRQMYAEREGIKPEMVYPHPIDLNCFPHGGDFLPNGYTTEEQKLIDETRKILRDPSIMVCPTVVRIPVVGGHSESVNVEFSNDFNDNEVVELLRNFPGITIQDNPSDNLYPMPRFAENKDDVFVGRIRRDISQPNSLNMWVVSDNLRKGAATNTIQIAEYLHKQGWIGE